MMSFKKYWFLWQINRRQQIADACKRVIKQFREYKLVQNETKPTSVDLGDGPKDLSQNMTASDRMKAWK